MKLLENKWAFVTGSSRGIDQQIALGLARRKFNIIVHGRVESNAAVDNYSRGLAAELHGTNVLVNCLDPSWLKTDLGGSNAENEVETVLPGALVPALLEDFGPSGRFYAAQDYKMLEF